MSFKTARRAAHLGYSFALPYTGYTFLRTPLTSQQDYQNTTQKGVNFCRANVGDRYVMQMLKQKGWSLAPPSFSSE